MQGIKNKLIILLARILFFFCFGLSRWKIEGEKYLDDAVNSDNPVFVCVWHGRSVFGAYYISGKKYPAYAIAGHHKDAELMARVLAKWGYGLIRGSSSRGGRDVVREMTKKFKQGKTVCITSDGPRGPAEIAKKGAVRTALECGAVIIPMTGNASRYWQFKSWDKFILPKPFSTIYLKIGYPIEYDHQNLSQVDGAGLVTKAINTLQNTTNKI